MAIHFPTLNRGIVKTGVGKAVLREIPVPRVRDGYLLLKTMAVAINPADWQDLDTPFRPGTEKSLLGLDCAGIVLAIGSGVTKEFKIGDRVAGISHGSNDLESEDGAFAQYVVVRGDLAIRLPEQMGWEEGSTLMTGVGTVALAVFRDLKADMGVLERVGRNDNRDDIMEDIEKEQESVLVYGGSSATGSLAVQFAKRAGMKVITTSSPKHFAWLRELGADYVFDYHDPNCGPQIRALTSNTLVKILDTIATPSTANICASAMSSTPGGHYVNLMGISFPRDDVKNTFVLGYTAMGECFEYLGDVYEVSGKDWELAKRVVAISERLLEEGILRTHSVGRREGGLSGVIEGMKELKEKGVSGVKLVYKIVEN